jgi:hypothetical protein
MDRVICPFKMSTYSLFWYFKEKRGEEGILEKNIHLVKLVILAPKV